MELDELRSIPVVLGTAQLVESEAMTDESNTNGKPRAATREEIAPLIALCRAGRLFDVQAWIAEGKPVNPPPQPTKGARIRSPLDVALETGFHSIVEVLLRAGAEQYPLSGYDSPVSRALQARRLDIIELLVEFGCNPRTVDMAEVLRSRDPKIFGFFIARDADLTTDQPFAQAFCERIRTALRPFKDLSADRPELMEQANIALRHHCKEGNVKWISLLLWVGADPLKPGSDTPGRGCADDEDGGLSALGYAALYNHYEIFTMKPVRTRLAKARDMDFIRYLYKGEGVNVLQRLLERGWKPNDQEDGGCSLIPKLIDALTWSGRWSTSYDSWLPKAGRRKFDSADSRDTMKAIHVLVRHGARWVPKDKDAIAQTRRSLLQMTANYTIEFIWILSKYRASDLIPLKELLGTPTMKANIAPHRERVANLLERCP
jgi:hypothetical protein